MSNLQFNFESESVKPINAKLLYVSASKFEDDWHSMMHTHPFAELFYVIKGKGRFTVEQHTFEVNEDDFILVNPEVSHTESSQDSKPLEYIVIGVKGLTFVFDQEQQTKGYSISNYQGHRTTFLFYLNALLKEIQNADDYSKIICQNTFEVLLVHMMRHAKLGLGIAPEKKYSRETSLAKRYIEANFKDDITLDDLAAFTHTNKYYLVHSFTKHYGLSPIQFLNQRRLEESKMLLRTTHYSMAEIAQITGFSSPSYFSQAFSNAFGVSPRRFKKSL